MNDQTICYWNIGVVERRKRLQFGIISFVIGIVVGVVLIALDVSNLWRLLLFLPFVGGGIGYFQAHEKT
ncbi:MAG: hypothetical protein D6737_01775 [Chloroflexi bacterium]|nr:MAG: hypothetical protein CUN54_01175 [Phototrophicales bacterium]RMF82387.1 MAG: hypothetical protein D6737_01775 [Chloroflexota bacterium]